eukprot:TRINITY_DN5228_c0_g1_i1.p1 TRINITY_DN5228_c0_g1~~TRINITY_DN5228_c0_g1_i1.p1  ORF type:complete len:1140 (+),score=365.12 TRINITY_DN5228_c0_g1_i1:55-3474(+)
MSPARCPVLAVAACTPLPPSSDGSLRDAQAPPLSPRVRASAATLPPTTPQSAGSRAVERSWAPADVLVEMDGSRWGIELRRFAPDPAHDGSFAVAFDVRVSPSSDLGMGAPGFHRSALGDAAYVLCATDGFWSGWSVVVTRGCWELRLGLGSRWHALGCGEVASGRWTTVVAGYDGTHAVLVVDGRRVSRRCRSWEPAANARLVAGAGPRGGGGCVGALRGLTYTSGPPAPPPPAALPATAMSVRELVGLFMGQQQALADRVSRAEEGMQRYIATCEGAAQRLAALVERLEDGDRRRDGWVRLSDLDTIREHIGAVVVQQPAAAPPAAAEFRRTPSPRHLAVTESSFPAKSSPRVSTLATPRRLQQHADPQPTAAPPAPAPQPREETVPQPAAVAGTPPQSPRRPLLSPPKAAAADGPSGETPELAATQPALTQPAPVARPQVGRRGAGLQRPRAPSWLDEDAIAQSPGRTDRSAEWLEPVPSSPQLSAVPAADPAPAPQLQGTIASESPPSRTMAQTNVSSMTATWQSRNVLTQCYTEKEDVDHAVRGAGAGMPDVSGGVDRSSHSAVFAFLTEGPGAGICDAVVAAVLVAVLVGCECAPKGPDVSWLDEPAPLASSAAGSRRRGSGSVSTPPRSAPKQTHVDKPATVQAVRAACPPDPSAAGLTKPQAVRPWLVIGDQRAARKVAELRRLGVTHVVNLAGAAARTTAKLYDGMEYSDEAAGAEAQYPLMQRHLGAVEAAASAAREKGGAVFVHCTTGANRSGALAAALLMKLERVPLLAAVRELHAAFPLVLQGHDGFVEQLVDVADAEGLAGDGQSTVASQLASASSAFQSDVFEGPATPMRPARGRRAGAASALPSSPSVAASRSPAAGNTSQPAASAAVSAASRRSSAAGDAGGLSEAKRAEWVARLRELAAFDKHFTALNRPARITERLYLGNAKAARNLGQLRDLGVTHVVNCAPVQCKIQPSSYEPLGIHVMSAAADDDPEYPIIRAHAADVSRFVDSAAAAGGAALVHCFQGVNRSAALVVAHLLLSGRVPLADAVRTVHTARPIILSNEGFVGQLVDLAAAEGLLEGAASDSTDGAYDTASFDAASAVAEVLAADRGVPAGPERGGADEAAGGAAVAGDRRPAGGAEGG